VKEARERSSEYYLYEKHPRARARARVDRKSFTIPTALVNYRQCNRGTQGTWNRVDSTRISEKIGAILSKSSKILETLQYVTFSLVEKFTEKGKNRFRCHRRAHAVVIFTDCRSVLHRIYISQSFIYRPISILTASSTLLLSAELTSRQPRTRDAGTRSRSIGEREETKSKEKQTPPRCT